MAYTPTNWKTGDTITQEKMNKLENGLSEVSNTAGTPGPQGEPGADGKSAYQIAVDNGFTGTETEWLASLKGEKGDPGTPGADGATGPAGADGLTTSISVNGTTYTQVNGKITLPDYPEAGGGATGVESFNGRTGAVIPDSGDYTAEMVGALASDGTAVAADKLSTARSIDGISFDGTNDINHYFFYSGTFPTKNIYLTINGFSLVPGANIFIEFKNNFLPVLWTSEEAPVLWINNSRGGNIYDNNGRLILSFEAGLYGFVYDGTAFKMTKAINKIMKGATSTSNGMNGDVPIPVIGDQDKFLCGDGTWKSISPEEIDAVSSTTVSTIASMTQSEYDALTEKVATVLYVIKE